MSYSPRLPRIFLIPITLLFFWSKIQDSDRPDFKSRGLKDILQVYDILKEGLRSIILWEYCFLFVLLSLYIVYLTILYPLYLSPIRHIPGPPLFELPSASTWNPLSYLLAPIKGQFSTMLSAETGIPQRDWLRKYGGEKGVVRVVGPVGIERVMFLSPEAYEKILVKEAYDYPKPDFFRDFYGLLTGDGLLTVEKDEHRQMKKMVIPAFSIPNLNSQVHKYYEAIDNLIRIFTDQIVSTKNPSEGAVLPVYRWVSRISLDMICTTTFSYTLNSLNDPNNELANAYKRMTNLQCGINHAWVIGFVGLLPKTAQFLKGEFGWRIRKLYRLLPGRLALAEIPVDSMHTIRRVAKRILEHNIEENNKNDIDHAKNKDLLSLLVRARKENLEYDSLTDKAIIDQILTFLSAGHDTTTAGITWTLYFLAANKEAQDKLREEVVPILSQDPRPEYRKIKDLQWLNCVVMESLRLLPPVPVIFRKAGKTDFIDGVLIPEGTLLHIPIRVINTWQAFWGPDAEDFRPERWLNLSTDKGFPSRYSFMSFMMGPHACLGRTMAMMQMKTVLASLIANFEFDLAYSGQVAKPTTTITMKPEDNLPLRVRLVGRKNIS